MSHFKFVQFTSIRKCTEKTRVPGKGSNLEQFNSPPTFRKKIHARVISKGNPGLKKPLYRKKLGLILKLLPSTLCFLMSMFGEKIMIDNDSKRSAFNTSHVFLRIYDGMRTG